MVTHRAAKGVPELRVIEAPSAVPRPQQPLRHLPLARDREPIAVRRAVMISHSKRSLWAAAAVGALMLGSSTTALAQSMPDTSLSRSTVGQEAKFSAVIDSLKAAGIAQQNAEAATAIGQACISAMQAQETQREQANFAAGQAELAAQAQANSNASGAAS